MAPKGLLCGRFVEDGFGYCRSCEMSPRIHVDQGGGLYASRWYRGWVLRKQCLVLAFLAPWLAAGDPGALFYEEPRSPWWLFILVCGMEIPGGRR